MAAEKLREGFDQKEKRLREDYLSASRIMGASIADIESPEEEWRIVTYCEISSDDTHAEAKKIMRGLSEEPGDEGPLPLEAEGKCQWVTFQSQGEPYLHQNKIFFVTNTEYYTDLASATLSGSAFNVKIVRSEDESELLRANFSFRDENQVIQFLRSHRHLNQILNDSVEKIQVYFPESQLSLRVMADPEDEDSKQLVLYIGCDLEPEKALIQLDKLDEDWWLDALDEAQNALCINLEWI